MQTNDPNQNFPLVYSISGLPTGTAFFSVKKKLTQIENSYSLLQREAYTQDWLRKDIHSREGSSYFSIMYTPIFSLICEHKIDDCMKYRVFKWRNTVVDIFCPCA
jgi:hypothetical protein